MPFPQTTYAGDNKFRIIVRNPPSPPRYHCGTYFTFFIIFTAGERSLGQGSIFRSVCQEFCPQGGGGWVGGGAIPACIAGGIPACLAAGLQGGGIPACLAGFQAHTQGGS